jgi:beta-glucosidase/6-phospho-beta-glucosidase/beta-galactosidase
MPDAAPLEVWGGLECSHVRIGDDFRDQIADTGHSGRPEDLDRIAALGIRTLRYPVLWERVCSEGPDARDWRWQDERLARLRKLGIRPIAGLIHHGSGPRWASVLDPHFVDAFANYAGQVAARYPWLELFTPVNEPLATARFSGLYGHWYPHGRDETVCFRFLVAECRAVAAAMKAIRAVTPEAKLVQTEDLGKVFATAELQYQADYENERRWLSLDLLAGRVTPDHRFWPILLDHGISEAHLAELAENPCPPDIIGIDHYLTSDRFLDHRLHLHPHEHPGGNGRDAYVDIAAPWSDIPVSETGWLPRLLEAWDRYRLPIAITEVHNGCTREEQLRWLDEAWKAALDARRQGADIRALTAWAMFGAVDWNSLLAERRGHCEPGLFDCRSSPPRATAVAAAVASLARKGSFQGPSLDRPGWWRRRRGERGGEPSRRLLLLGQGEVAQTVAHRCALRGLDILRRAKPGRNGRDATDFWAMIETEDPVRGRNGASRAIFRCWRSHHSFAPAEPLWDRDSFSAPLSVELGKGVDLDWFADACLDLLIDEEEGAVRIVKDERGAPQIVFLSGQDTNAPFVLGRPDRGLRERRYAARPS